ncbi:hypothetical protein [Candidatus Nanohalococcus occultus]|uniref:Uncharacterized protein n=1 Tax=Candidatus Nanohalococcus occultus TaxID=2978047 RepID=A0ABY8CDK4_9ARCH|nr:hypothetical protein SVXNc_0260 [Candidatus Nanohaloarchaeota archaeon SVXNc]
MKFNHNRKGQSAIEYLMTYGWMLLVVAIVGGAIFMTVNQNTGECSSEVPMDLQVAEENDFGVAENGYAVSDGNVQVRLANAYSTDVTVNNVTFGDTELTAGSNTLSQNEEVVFSSGSFTASDSCNDFTLEIDYTRNGLNDTRSGTLQGEVE